MEEPNKYCFTSDLFDIDAGEDEDTNPGIYGKSLAKWLSGKFKELGYSGAEYGAEDWGWYVSCTNRPYHIFIACSNFVDCAAEYDENNPPKGNEVVWQCFVGADRPWFRNPFRKLDVSKEAEIEGLLFKLLGSAQGINEADK